MTMGTRGVIRLKTSQLLQNFAASPTDGRELVALGPAVHMHMFHSKLQCSVARGRRHKHAAHSPHT